MKKLLILFSIILIGCSGREDVIISGIVNNGDGTGLLLQQMDGHRMKKIDSVVVKRDNTFKFRTELENPELLFIKNDQGKIINLLPSPGEKINVETSYDNFGKDYRVSGSEDSEKIRELVLHLFSTRERLDSISGALNNLKADDSLKIKVLKTAYGQTYIDQKRYNIRFIIENVKSPTSVYALYQKLNDEVYLLNSFNDLQYFKFVADSMEVYCPGSTLTQSLVEDIRTREQQIEENKRLQELISAAEEKSILDISIPDPNGDSISITDFKNHVVLMYFWSSEVPASLQSLMALKGTYNKYHDRGFDVYAISLDNDPDKWKSAIRYNQFDWTNVSELSYPGSKTDKIYNVTSLPANFLINRKGELVVRDIYGRNLEIWLDNLL